MPWPSNTIGSFDRALAEHPEGLATIIAIKPASGIVRMTTWPADVRVSFVDRYVAKVSAPTDFTFTAMNGLASFAFPDPSAPIANDSFFLSFADFENAWINRFRQEPRGILAAAWSVVWNGSRWVGPQDRWHGKTAIPSQTPTEEGLITRTECRGPFHQTGTQTPEVVSDDAQRELDDSDNSNLYLESLKDMPWGLD